LFLLEISQMIAAQMSKTAKRKIAPTQAAYQRLFLRLRAAARVSSISSGKILRLTEHEFCLAALFTR